MATASGEGKGTRRPVLPIVAYAVVAALIVAAAVAFWTGVLRSDRPSPANPKTAAPTEPARTVQGLPLPPRPAQPEAAEPPRQEPAVSSPPSPSEAPATETPDPKKTACTADIGPWPSDKTEQAKAIQILLRDLGLYGGTTYGTVGPSTRAAIRAFQLAAGEAETGEPGEALFEALKKKCAAQ